MTDAEASETFAQMEGILSRLSLIVAEVRASEPRMAKLREANRTALDNLRKTAAHTRACFQSLIQESRERRANEREFPAKMA